jgi:CPA2 family monovalent cation:H+ antiporter-2
MHDAHAFLQALAIVLGVAALTTVLFQRLRQPVILGYLVAGLIVGPHLPVPLVADAGIVRTLSELGVILLMFALGLEFSLARFLKAGPTVSLTALIESSAMVGLGYGVGRLFGWTATECLFTGAMVAVSSTTIIARAFDAQKVEGPLRDFVVGILVVEDLIAIALMAILTAVTSGTGLSAGALALTTLKLLGFLVGLVAVGLLLVPRFIRAVVKLSRPETTLVASIGVCFAVALLAQAFGYSVALGAFLAGSLVAESGEAATIEPLVAPVRDLFAAVFFVSVGMLIDPALVVQHAGAIAALVALVVVGKVLSVTVGAFLTGHGVRTSVQAAMGMAQIGEFSFILAELGGSLNATGAHLYPIAVAVSAVTTLSTPWMVSRSGAAAGFVDKVLPRPLQLFAALYGSWVEALRAAPQRTPLALEVRRLVRLLVADAALLLVLLVGTSLALRSITTFASERTGLSAAVAQPLVVGAAAALAAPFCVGITRLSRRLGTALAQEALPLRSDGKMDLAAAPRRALVAAFQLAIALLIGAPLLAITQPFIPGPAFPLLALGVAAALGLGFWKSATNLQGHVRAGAEVILETLSAQARAAVGPHAAQPTDAEAGLAALRGLLPGLGEPTPVQLSAKSPALGKTLAQLNLRGETGATVLAIARGGQGVLVPSAQEVLQAGDVLALAGTHEAIAAASAVLGEVKGDASALPRA